jgi:hypothetical protein
MRHAECCGHGESIVGDLILGCEVFSPAGDRDLVVALHAAEPGSPPERGLHRLARWGTGLGRVRDLGVRDGTVKILGDVTR